jgi:hypothetical protein
MSFHLCEECLAKYRALVFDPSAHRVPCHIPFDSIIWTDEHKPAREGALFGHDFCLRALIQLTTTRKQLWRTGKVPAAYEQHWRRAQELMPGWPGFRRQSLTASQLAALDACERETASMMEDVQEDAGLYVKEQLPGDVVRFTAYPPEWHASG